jgi:hypothetical protein
VSAPARATSPSRPRRFACAAALFAFAVAFAFGPRSALAVTIGGRVLKGEAREPTSGIPVSLHIIRGDREVPGTTTSSGAGGVFVFPNLKADPGLSYFLSTEYEGAFYTEGPVEIPRGAAEATKDIVIYDVGRDIASVRVSNHHIVVERQPEALQITEIMVFENTGKTAYLGTGLNHAENVGVRLGLPASVKAFAPGMGGDEQTVRVQGRDLASLRPIPPGQRPFSFTYQIPLSGRMDLSHRLYFPTDKFVVMIQDPTLKLRSSALEYTGPREQGGKTFQIYEASNVPVGAEIPMRIGGAGFWSNPKIYPWILAPFVIVAVLIFAARRGKRVAETALPAPASGPGPVLAPAPGPLTAGPVSKDRSKAAGGDSPKSSDEEFANVYLYLIDALDRGLERGEFSRETHGLIRGNLKRRLEAILSDQTRTGTR